MENEIVESAHRYDSIPLETKFDTTPEGFLSGTAIVTRIGVFPYMMKDGTVRYELRHPDDVFHQDSLSTFLMKPITNDHPKVGLVTADNAKEYVVGSAGSTTVHNDRYLAMPIVIHDAKAIKDIKQGKRELSCGYKCDVVPESGVYDGTVYTHRQKNIRGNHIAVVQKGRSGSTARIRLDGALAPIDIENTKEIEMDDNMSTIKLDSVEYKADAQVVAAYEKAVTAVQEVQVKLDEALASISAITSEKSAIEADRDVAKERLDSITKELETIKADSVPKASVAQLVKDRVAVEAFAVKAEVEVKADMSDIDIKKAVVLKHCANVKAEKLEDVAYLTARYDSVVEDWEVTQKKLDDQKVREVQATKVDSADKPVKSYAEAHAEYRKQLSEAHKRK